MTESKFNVNFFYFSKVLLDIANSKENTALRQQIRKKTDPVCLFVASVKFNNVSATRHVGVQVV